MDPHGRDEFNEDLLENIIRGGDNDVTSLFLNNSGERDEELNRRDGSDEGEVDRSGEGRSGDGTLITTNTSGQVYIHISLMKHVLSIYLYINALFFL